MKWFERRAEQRRIKLLEAIGNGNYYGIDMARAAGRRIGSIYPDLAKLEADGFVQSWFEDEGHSPRRRRYRVTTRGWMHIPIEMDE